MSAGTDRPTAKRRISRQGNSLMIAIPHVFLLNMRLVPGDDVILVFDHEWGGFFVRPLVPVTLRQAAPAAAAPVGSVEP